MRGLKDIASYEVTRALCSVLSSATTNVKFLIKISEEINRVSNGLLSN